MNMWAAEFLHMFSSRGLSPQWLQNRACLDVGGGRGLVSAALAYWGASRVVLADNDVTALLTGSRLLRRFSCVQFVRADIYDLPFGSNTFECVVCLRVLHHLENPSAAVEELKRVMTYDGLLLVN